MPEMKDLNQFAILTKPVIDPHGRMQKFANAWSPGDRLTQPWKAPQQVHVVQQRRAKPFRRRRIIAPDIVEKIFEID